MMIGCIMMYRRQGQHRPSGQVITIVVTLQAQSASLLNARFRAVKPEMKPIFNSQPAMAPHDETHLPTKSQELCIKKAV